MCFYGLPLFYRNAVNICPAASGHFVQRWRHIQGGVILEENQGYVIRRTILFDNKCGFVLGENPKAPNPYVTWQFN